MSARKRSISHSSLEDDDAPDLSLPGWQEKFAAADLKEGDHVLKRGRPPIERPKIATTIRLSADVVDHFKAGGKGWQSRIDAALSAWIAHHAKR
jgi:uncharacterized protein (DUF4415 family)